MHKIFFLLLLIFSCSASAEQRSTGSDNARLYFITPQHNATVKGEFTVHFGLKGFGLAPAGVNTKNTGHHHLIIDAPLPSLGKPIPANTNYRHFGGGQTEVNLKLEPGTHTLQLLLGNYLHTPHFPPIMSKQITVTVE